MGGKVVRSDGLG